MKLRKDAKPSATNAPTQRTQTVRTLIHYTVNDTGNSSGICEGGKEKKPGEGG